MCLVVCRTDPMCGHPVLVQVGEVHRTRWHQLNLSQVGSRKKMGASVVSILSFEKPVTCFISGRQCNLLCQMEVTMIHVLRL